MLGNNETNQERQGKPERRGPQKAGKKKGICLE